MTKNTLPQEINRSALIVRPRQALEDWINQVEGKKVFDLSRADSSVYLIPEEFDTEDPAIALQPHYKQIFESELESWYTDRSLWPADLSLASFRNFFDISFAGTVWDTTGEPFEVYIS